MINSEFSPKPNFWVGSQPPQKWTPGFPFDRLGINRFRGIEGYRNKCEFSIGPWTRVFFVKLKARVLLVQNGGWTLDLIWFRKLVDVFRGRNINDWWAIQPLMVNQKLKMVIMNSASGFRSFAFFRATCHSWVGSLTFFSAPPKSFPRPKGVVVNSGGVNKSAEKIGTSTCNVFFT